MTATIQQAMSHAIKKCQFESAQLDCELLLAYTIKKSRSYVYAFPEHKLNDTEQQLFMQLIEQRVQGIPLAYLTGTQEFWSMPFHVDENVLIPRPETEILIETVLEKVMLQPAKEKTLLDLGTGSGCIAIALAKELPDWHITAVDQSEAALSIAKHNAKNHNIQNITFVKSNWFNELNQSTYDVIVSNPPYIAENDSEIEQHVAQYEPEIALIASDNGLSAYKTITQQAQSHMHLGALLAFEIGHTQASAIKALLEAFVHVEVRQDLQGLDRVVMAYKQ